MQYRSFGKTDIQISEIGHGTWAMGNMWGPTDDATSVEALLKGFELGINFVDTAWIYGNGRSEKIVASALKRWKGNQVYVATKIPPKNMRWPASHEIPVQEVFPASHILEYTEKSLQNLKSDCIDLQQLHVWSDTWMHQGDWLEELAKLKEQGKVRWIGVSINDHEPDTALEIVSSGIIDSVQVIYNIFDQSSEEKLFPLCQEKGVAVIVRVPFDEGSLTGTLTPQTVFHKEDWRKRYFKGDRLQETCQKVEKLKFLIRDEIKTLSQAALKFCLSHPAVSTVIPGMRKSKHVEENCKASDGKLLKPEELQELKKHAWLRNFYH